MIQVRAQIASIPARIRSLENAIKSLQPQVNNIQVVLNNYDRLPDISHRKVKYIHMTNEFGDAAKFYGVEEFDGYFFSCDDDLIYPPDYVQRMIAAINQHHCLVTMHGKIFKQRPIGSYHHGAEKFRCLGSVDIDTYVDVAGSGCAAFHTDDLKLKLSDFQKPNMADIWLSKIAHEQGVKILCLAHPVGYFGYNHHEDNIYDNNHRNESYQTELINTFLK